MTTCISPEGCLSKAQTRGLCGKHYQRCQQDVQARLTTWKKLADQGKCLPKTKVRGRFMMGKEKNRGL